MEAAPVRLWGWNSWVPAPVSLLCLCSIQAPLKNTPEEPPPWLAGARTHTQGCRQERGTPALRFKAVQLHCGSAIQTPVLSTCLSKLPDSKGQNHLPLAFLMSKWCHSTREGGTWISVDQKSSPQIPQGKPEGRRMVDFPRRRGPYLPSHSGHKNKDRSPLAEDPSPKALPEYSPL